MRSQLGNSGSSSAAVGRFCGRLFLALLVALIAAAQAKVAAQDAEGKPADDPVVESVEPEPAEADEATDEVAAAADDAAADDAPLAADDPRLGYYLKIPSPVSSAVYSRVAETATRIVNRASESGKRPVLIFELTNGDSSGSYGQTLDLAKFISGRKLSGASTVAYVPEGVEVTGHNVLLAIACGEIMMHPDARIGDAGRDEEIIEPDVRSGYTLIAKRRRTIEVDLALGLLDKSLEVWSVQTNFGRDYVLSERLPEVQERATVLSQEVLIPVGETGLFTGEEARKLGFVSFLPKDLPALARRLGLPPDGLREDPSLFDKWRPVQVELKGPITARSVQRAERTLDARITNDDSNFLLLRIDSPGGSPLDAANLANYLAALQPGERRTVAYIPSEARADTVLIVLACDHIVLHRDAVLGGAGALEMDEEQVKDAVTVAKAIAKEKSRSWSLYAAMLDPNLEVRRYTRTDNNLVQYFCEEEFAEQENPDLWQVGEVITKPGKPLSVTGAKADEYMFATHVVNGFGELKGAYNLENDPALAEPTWADVLIDALASPAVATFLLIIGGAALYAELQMPGIGIGGLISAICFLLYFWANFLGGTAGWLEAIMFLTGVICIMLEVFVLPGFGVFGIFGGLLTLASLVLAAQTFVWPQNTYQFSVVSNSLLMLCGSVVGIAVAAALMRRWLPHTPMLSGMMLEPPREQVPFGGPRVESTLESLVGERGTAITRLIPAGKAHIGGRTLNVVSDGQAIDPGAVVEVVSARGSHVVVRAVE